MASIKTYQIALASAVAVITMVALVVTPGCGSSGSSSSNAVAPVTINAKNDAAAPMGFSFDSPVTVARSATVQWSNTSTAPHGIIWDAQVPASSPAPGANIPNFGADVQPPVPG